MNTSIFLAGLIFGTISYSNGGAVHNATVEVYKVECATTALFDTTYTDEHGFFNLENVPTGSYYIEPKKPEHKFSPTGKNVYVGIEEAT